jgi:hypothetical protein
LGALLLGCYTPAGELRFAGQAIVMSDKSIVHDTQLMRQTYWNEVIKHHPNGIYVATTGKRRRVLTSTP